MSVHVFHWIMIAMLTFCALMVVTRFALYRPQDRGMGPVYFWGGCLFVVMALTDLSAALFYSEELHIVQTALFTVLAALSLFRATKKPKEEQEHAVAEVPAS
jgi:hypothetical protein